MPIDVKNIYRPIVRGTEAGKYNTERYDLAKLTYGIYGLASFKLAPSSTCVAIDVDVEVKDLYNVIVRTDNTDSLTDIFVAADFYSKNNINLCSASSTPSRTMTQITSKTYLTVPDLAIKNQDIALIENNPTKFKLTGNSLESGSSTITYNISLNYENFVSGNAYKIALKLSETVNGISDGSWDTTFTNNPIKYVKWVTEIDGKVVYDVNLTSAVSPSTLESTGKDIGLAIKSTNPVIRFYVTIPRPIGANK